MVRRGKLGASVHRRLRGLLGAVYHGLSGRAAPQVSRSRYTDGEERHRIGWHRGGCTAPCSSWRLPSSTAPAGFTIRTHSDVPISGVATNKNTSTSGCYECRGCLGRSPRSSGRRATLGQRRAAGAPIAASGTTRGSGSVHLLPQHSFDARGGSDIAFVSTVGLALIAIGAGRLSSPRRFAGCSTRRGTRGRLAQCGLIRAAV